MHAFYLWRMALARISPDVSGYDVCMIIAQRVAWTLGLMVSLAAAALCLYLCWPVVMLA